MPLLFELFKCALSTHIPRSTMSHLDIDWRAKKHLISINLVSPEHVPNSFPVFPFSPSLSVYPPSVLFLEASDTSGNLRWDCRVWGSPGEGALIKQGLDPISNQHTVTDFQNKNNNNNKKKLKLFCTCFGLFFGFVCFQLFSLDACGCRQFWESMPISFRRFHLVHL